MRDQYEIIPLWTGFDNWNAQYFTTEMESNNFIMEIVIQGAKTMSAPMKQLEAEFKGRKINYNNNPVLKWNLTNTQIKSDDNGNIRPIKGRSPKQRIDGTVSLIDAFVIYMRHFEDYQNLL
jgi:phage terminase large subunit-like protein